MADLMGAMQHDADVMVKSPGSSRWPGLMADRAAMPCPSREQACLPVAAPARTGFIFNAV